MTIGKKILGGYMAMSVLLVIVAALGLYSLRKVGSSYSQVLEKRQRVDSEVQQLTYEVRDQDAQYRGFLLYPGYQARYEDSLFVSYGQFASALGSLRKLVSGNSAVKLLDEMGALQAERVKGQGKVIALAKRGKRAKALSINTKNVLPISRQIVALAAKVLHLELRVERNSTAALNASMGRFSWAMILISILAVGLALTSGIMLTRSVTRQVRESVAQLSTSASEILAMTTQVAASASETATAVTETTATVEEVKQTAQVSSQKIRVVSESSQKMTQVSQAGKRSVQVAIEGMNDIRHQMDSIAETVVSLSEQSQAIGGIIATVNDLAEQSNLLAVNAAIEAAKAGEQGKGFGVVAQEIRSLAEQSKQATAQVREILSDIQKATNAAVMATEQGSKAVETGVKQSTEAGESIRTLTENIAESTQAAIQIAASSQQQVIGMDQVAMAMENIKQASAQNVAGTKQAEAAAQNLHDLGRKLSMLVESPNGREG